jgi:hypothetical protein
VAFNGIRHGDGGYWFVAVGLVTALKYGFLQSQRCVFFNLYCKLLFFLTNCFFF